MSARPTENETWIVERGGDIVEKRAQGGSSLSTWERLVYCLWVTDYMMRNTGDFADAVDLYPTFQSDAKDLSRKLSVPLTYDAFSLSADQLQREYFDRFETMCDEIRRAAQVTDDA